MTFALRCLGRAVTRTLFRLPGESWTVAATPTICSSRFYYGERKSSNIDFTKIKVQDLDESQLTDFEISKDPEEWKFVERLLPLQTVPKPKEFDGVSPAGWVPPKNNLNLPYFIARNKNHMQPVYLRRSYVRNQRKITVVRKIHGDIWQLERDLKAFLESKRKTAYIGIASKVNELSAAIYFRGDHVAYIKQWMNTKGF